MGIRFACSHCGHVLNVKQELAGKRGFCPKCKSRVDIPLTSTVEKPTRAREEDTPGVAIAQADEPPAPLSAPAAGPSTIVPSPTAPAPAPVLAVAASEPAAMADPIAEAPHLQWYVLPPGAPSPYGPAPGEMLRSWIAEGRVSGDSMVWRQDWPDWRPAAKALPQLSAVPIPSLAAMPAAPPTIAPTSAWHNSPAPAEAAALHPMPVARRKKSPVALIIALSVLVLVLTIAAWWVIVQ